MQESDDNFSDFRELMVGVNKYRLLLGMISEAGNVSPVFAVINSRYFLSKIRWYRGNISSLEIFLFFVIFIIKKRC